MKKTLAIFSALILSQAVFAQDPAGAVVYSLPSTTLTFDVEAVQENFYAGPYAKYAAKYLGIQVREEDQTTCHISKVTMTPFIEADQAHRFVLDVPAASAASFLQLSSQGLIAFSDGSLGESGVWRFPSAGKGDFSDKGVVSNLLTEETTLYRNGNTSYNHVSVQQNMVVEKSPEKRAAETAEIIFGLRKKRVQIITGDTDATYSGAAMGAAIDEITRLEKEYMTLFTGYSEFKDLHTRFEVVPQVGEVQKYVAFRISETAGLVEADDLSGSPVVLELIPDDIASAATAVKPSKGTFATIRIPAICKVKLYKGADVLLQSRVPVYQLGIESYYPIKTK